MMTNRQKVLLLMRDGSARTIPEVSKAIGVPQSTLSDLFNRLVKRKILIRRGKVKTPTYNGVNTYQLIVPYEEAVKPYKREPKGVQAEILNLTASEPMAAFEIAELTEYTESQISQACIRLCRYGDLRVVERKKGPRGYLVTVYEPKVVTSFAMFRRLGKTNVMGVWQ